MNKILIFLVILSLSVFAANQQAFAQEIYQNGSSKISRNIDLSIFSSRLGTDGLTKMYSKCNGGFLPICSVNTKDKTLYIEEYFEADNQNYEFSSDGGFPYITYTLNIHTIPTDKFVSDTDRLLLESGALNGQNGPSGSSPLDLTANNSNFLSVVKLLNANLSYSVIMPGVISSATSGNYSGIVSSGQYASFNLVPVLQNRSPMVIRSKELNLTMIVMILAAICLIFIAYMFFGSSRKVQKSNKTDLKKVKKK